MCTVFEETRAEGRAEGRTEGKAEDKTEGRAEEIVETPKTCLIRMNIDK